MSRFDNLLELAKNTKSKKIAVAAAQDEDVLKAVKAAAEEKVEKIYASVFNTEDALVRPSIASGTHALYLTLSGILDGDHVIVNSQHDAKNGDIVVALIGDEATVKTFYREKDHIRLQPQNSSMDPILIKDPYILGVVKALVRKY
jgi:cystathionine beta-lyase family protein involved in aluminum resistance